MRLIPEDTFRTVEWRIRNRKRARKEAERILAEALSDAVSLTGPLARTGTTGKGTPGDPTGRGAARVIRATEALEETEAWEKVFQRTERDFPPGSEEHQIASLHYECGWTLKEIAQTMHYEKQTILRKRDAFVYRAAWYAAEAGLTGRNAE